MWRRVRENKDERFHYLRLVRSEEDALSQGLPYLAVDFKRYFTIPTDEMYAQLQAEARRRARLVSPYLEHFCSRFAYFQQRIALADDHHVRTPPV